MRVCSGSTSVKYWVNTDRSRTLPRVKGVTLSNCPIGKDKPKDPLECTVSIFTEYHEIRFPKGRTDFLIRGSADDSAGKLWRLYAERGLVALKYLHAPFWGLTINVTESDLRILDMQGSQLISTVGDDFYKIKDMDTYHPDYFEILSSPSRDD